VLRFRYDLNTILQNFDHQVSSKDTRCSPFAKRVGGFAFRINGDVCWQIEAKLKQDQHSANRIAVEQDKAKTVEILRIANVQRRRYSISGADHYHSSINEVSGLSNRLGDIASASVMN